MITEDFKDEIRIAADNYAASEKDHLRDAAKMVSNPDPRGYDKDGADRVDPYCAECMLKEFPPCEKSIPCCKCKDNCNSRQPCPKKGGDR